DVRHVHRLSDVGDVLIGGENPLPENGLTDVADIDEVVVGRSDVEIDVHPGGDGALVPILTGASRGQRRPADIIAARAPRDPCRAPFAPRHPDPAATAQPDPATVV